MSKHTDVANDLHEIDDMKFRYVQTHGVHFPVPKLDNIGNFGGLQVRKYRACPTYLLVQLEPNSGWSQFSSFPCFASHFRWFELSFDQKNFLRFGFGVFNHSIPVKVFGQAEAGLLYLDHHDTSTYQGAIRSLSYKPISCYSMLQWDTVFLRFVSLLHLFGIWLHGCWVSSNNRVPQDLVVNEHFHIKTPYIGYTMVYSLFRQTIR